MSAICFLQVLSLKNQKQKPAITSGNRKPYLSTQLPPNIISENQNISECIINSVRLSETNFRKNIFF